MLAASGGPAVVARASTATLLPPRARSTLALPLSTPVAGHDAIEAALAHVGLRARRIEALSPPGPIKRGRATVRVDLEGGRTIKARLLESDDAAQRLHALCARLEPAFSRAIGHAGPVLLEEWIEGVPLAEPDAWIETAAALLGRLHATPIAAAPARIASRRWRDEGHGDLADLAAAGLLAPADQARLAAILDATDPGDAPLVLAHRDFCAENMIVDGAGALRVIDNEWLSPQPAGLDLARTACRWPMSAAGWRRFLGAYRAAAPVDPGPLAFWEVSALAWTARVRLRLGPERTTGALAQLLAVAAREAGPS